MGKPHRLVGFAGAVGQRFADHANPLADHCCVHAGPEHARLGAIGHGDLIQVSSRSASVESSRLGGKSAAPASSGSRLVQRPSWRTILGQAELHDSGFRPGRWSGPERPTLGTRPAAQHRRPAAGRRGVAAESGRRAESRCRRATRTDRRARRRLRSPGYAQADRRAGQRRPGLGPRVLGRRIGGAEQQRDPQRVIDSSV